MLHTQAIVLSKRKIRNYDTFVTLLTPHRGKINALVRGGLRMKSKLAPHLEPPGLVEVSIAFGKNMNHVAGASLFRDFSDLRRNFSSLQIFQRLAHSMTFFSRENHNEHALFDLLTDWIEKINQESREYASTENSVLIIFLWQLLSLLGHTPELTRCVRNGHALTFPVFLSITQGGVLCTQCLIPGEKLPSLTTADLSRLRYFLETPPKDQDFSIMNGETSRIMSDWILWYAPEYASPASLHILQRYLSL